MFSTRIAFHFLPIQYFKAISRSSHNEVRVRFAPSPTGYLHLGGLRTALYNFMYARRHNGKFLLRIEDTDQSRLVPNATNALINDLQWVGIIVDEGPNVGGNAGPYIQSERKNIYLNAVETLLKNGTAYRCFCTERRLELIRKEAIRTRQIPRYDNKCRNLTSEQVSKFLKKGNHSCIRFKLNDYTEPLQDIIYGPIHYNVFENEGDPIIVKTDGFPTYHFANVVDDHLMKISHVFRGVEWQISTTKHLLLYKAFGWQPPHFGHLPLLVNSDGTKLSKRQGDISIESFRTRGYFPEALINYVVSAGGGFYRERHTKPQILNIQELITQFDITKVNSNPSRLNPELLNNFNRLQISKLINNPATLSNLVLYVQNLIRRTFPNEKYLDIDSFHVENVLRWATDRLIFIDDLVSDKFNFLWIRPTEVDLKDIHLEQLSLLLKQLENLEFSKNDINQMLKKFSKDEHLKFSSLMKLLRSALSGLKEGPAVAEMMEILGKEVVLERLRTTHKIQTNKHKSHITNTNKL